MFVGTVALNIDALPKQSLMAMLGDATLPFPWHLLPVWCLPTTHSCSSMLRLLLNCLLGLEFACQFSALSRVIYFFLKQIIYRMMLLCIPLLYTHTQSFSFWLHLVLNRRDFKASSCTHNSHLSNACIVLETSSMDQTWTKTINRIMPTTQGSGIYIDFLWFFQPLSLSNRASWEFKANPTQYHPQEIYKALFGDDGGKKTPP